MAFHNFCLWDPILLYCDLKLHLDQTKGYWQKHGLALIGHLLAQDWLSEQVVIACGLLHPIVQELVSSEMVFFTVREWVVPIHRDL